MDPPGEVSDETSRPSLMVVDVAQVQVRHAHERFVSAATRNEAVLSQRKHEAKFEGDVHPRHVREIGEPESTAQDHPPDPAESDFKRRTLLGHRWGKPVGGRGGNDRKFEATVTRGVGDVDEDSAGIEVALDAPPIRCG